MERPAISRVETSKARSGIGADTQATPVAAFVDNRPSVVALRKLAEAMDNSPRVAAQRKISEAMQTGPRMAAQCALTAPLAAMPPSRASSRSAVAQRVSAEELPGLEEVLRQLIFDYFTEQVAGSDAGLRRAHAILVRNNVVSWLKTQDGFGAMSVNAARDAGMAHFEEAFAPRFLPALRLNAAETWVRTNTGLEDGQFEISDRRLTPGNCHGLTFGNDRDMVFNPDLSNLLENWETIHSPEIAIFLSNGALAHSARRTDSGYLNTLPDGPAFYCDPAVLAQAMGYDPVYLLPDDLQAVQQLTAENQDEDAQAEEIDEAARILGYGSELNVGNAKQMFRAFDELDDDQKLIYIGQNSVTIQNIKDVLITQHNVRF